MGDVRRILVADDDADTRVIVSSVVSILGHEPIVVADGAEAVRVCEAELPDLMVVDFMMPEYNGVEVCRKVRTFPGGDCLPVLMLTARDTVQDKIFAFEEGVDDYLTKPFNYRELQARIRALLRMRDLNLAVRQKSEELQSMQAQIVEQQRQLAVGQLAGAAAHQLGQPLSAIMLNCFLLEQLPKDDPRFKVALAAIQSDARRMADMIEKLRTAKASEREGYIGNAEILKLS
jgi:DNA-binding response OmpR family regulator